MEKNTEKTFQHHLDRILEVTVLKLVPFFVSPNSLTVLRFILLPFVLYFVWIGDYTFGFIIFTISALSDLIDGALARTRNHITKWGMFFDPLADKLLIGLTGLLLLFRFDLIHLAITIIIIDFVIGISAIYKGYFQGSPVKAHMTGKLKLMFQALGIGGVFLYAMTNLAIFFTLALWLLSAAVFFGIVSLLVYHSA